MARRRLEAAIHAGKAIEQGRELPGGFRRLECQFLYNCDAMREGVYSLQYSYDSKLLVVGYGDGSIQVISTKTGTLLKDVRKHKHMAMAVTCIRFNPKEQHVFLATSVEGKVHAGSVIDGTLSDIASEPDNEINCLDFSLDGLSFATAGKDLDIRIYDTTTKKRTHVYEGFRYSNPDHTVSGHAQRVFALKYHPENEGVFITGGWDNHLKVWDARTEEGVVRTIKGPHICGDSIDIKDNQVLTGSWVAKDALQIWDFREGSLVENLPFDNEQGEFIYSAQFCDHDTVLAGGSGTNNVQAVNTKTKKCIGKLELGHPVQALDSTLGGRLFALGGAGYQLKLATMS